VLGGLSPHGRRTAAVLDAVAAIVLALVAAVALATFRDYGVTWDETWHLEYGELIRRYWATGGRELGALTYHMDYLYGGAFDLAGAILVHTSGGERYAVIHAFGAWIGLVGLMGAWRLARGIAGPLAGLCALILLALSPVYYGHIFMNPKDVPFAVGYVWALVYLVDVLRELPAVRRATWIRLALACGAAMSVRIGGLLTLCYLAMILVGFIAARTLADRNPRTAVALGRRLALPVAGTVAGAWLVMVLAWPWGLADPLRRPFVALANMTHFHQHERQMPFAGDYIWTWDVRWDYLPRYFAFNMTEVLLGLLALATVGAITGLARRWRRGESSRADAIGGLLAVAILFPAVYTIWQRSPLYDGLRHFLFLVPPSCAVGGVAAARLLERAFARDTRLGIATAAVGIGLAAELVWTLHKLHPHEYVFFNRLVGGLPGAYMRYSTDYYGNTYKEAFDRLDAELWREDPDAYLDRTWVIAGCLPLRSAREYMRPAWIWRTPGSRLVPQFYAGYTRNKCHLRYADAPVLAEVRRFGTLLNVVKDLRGRTSRAVEEPVGQELDDDETLEDDGDGE
jgi:hypothetical protein